ncbi:helix-turn-helix domain-containing protein [Archangium sp.]|uniref:helix-turn-helix domain-containing protein n=1 Tax=Archangium sp. TaxID=1872627 RepID=UPI00286D630C|nr:helix-turn-helix domain-containing protein [Archangium sp.]
MKHFEQQSYYELLEIQVTATEEQILDAYARAMETYAPDSIAVYTLADPGQLEILRQRLTLAMETLSELDKRLRYDQSIGVKRSAGELALLRAESLKRAAGAEPTPEVEAKPAAEKEPEEEVLEAVEVVAEEEPVAEQTPAEPEPVAAALVQPAAPARAPMPGMSRPASHSRSIPLVSRPGTAVPPPLPARSALRAPVHAAAEAAARQRLAAEAAAAAPPASEPEKGRAPSRPVAAQQLGEAPVLSQAAAIATAESALAQVAGKARDSRTRLKTVVDVPSDAEFNGELLRRIREGRSLSLQMLADRTRISSRHVEAIEADRYGSLPAAVYLRGMLMSIARELGLDPLRVSRSYMTLVSEGEKKRR